MGRASSVSPRRDVTISYNILVITMEHPSRKIAGPHESPHNAVAVILSDADKCDGNAARKTDSVFDVQHRLASRVSAADMSTGLDRSPE